MNRLVAASAPLPALTHPAFTSAMHRAASFKTGMLGSMSSSSSSASSPSTTLPHSSTCAKCAANAANAANPTAQHQQTHQPTARPKLLRFNVDPSLWSDELYGKFVQLHVDEGTQAFLNECKQVSFSLWRHWFHSWSRAVLSPVASVTGINGLLQRGQMHVASAAQFKQLLEASYPGSVLPKLDSLLDIGAGDGNVTSRLAPLFSSVTATEASSIMSWRLWQRGYTAINTISLDSDPRLLGPFDTISCLNVLDRCERPKTLLLDMKKRLKPVTGRLVLAVVLPFRPYVEFSSNPGGASGNKPIEHIKLFGTCFEQWAEELIEKVIKPCGFSVEAVSRSPYLCHGDYYEEYYMLDDLLLVLKPVD